MGRQTLLKISAGRSNGDLRTWMKLAKVFGVGMDELLAPVWVESVNSTFFGIE
ncbi:transcription regulator [Paenarthrobacter nicotinovorans]|nr:transcription regulator [Paenarthrobacter nicotinovorans]